MLWVTSNPTYNLTFGFNRELSHLLAIVNHGYLSFLFFIRSVVHNLQLGQWGVFSSSLKWSHEPSQLC